MREGPEPDRHEIFAPEYLLDETEGSQDDEDDGRPVARIRVGFARRLLDG
jgi:hypothetical protein